MKMKKISLLSLALLLSNSTIANTIAQDNYNFAFNKGHIVDTGNKPDLNFEVNSSKSITYQAAFSKYINVNYNNYNNALFDFNSIKDSFLKNDFNIVSSCEGIRCGNTIENAIKIHSSNFISDKLKQKYFLIKKDDTWQMLHLTSYEKNSFIFFRTMEKVLPSIGNKKLIVADSEISIVNFNTNTTSLDVVTQSFLIDFAEINVNNKNNYYIIGHTDDVGSPDYNLSLAMKRAETVTQFLINQGLSKSRLEVDTVGELAPLFPNSSPSGRERNRRVEIITRTNKL
ncbi:OmpA family protein [Pseudoalteromonas sp. TB64]|uniref:OmpA family protein n=1 Tax=Pseudoalteromonas sp. TB64 TaxID=1938600 RepID=UPI00040C9E46|nr:OmpA family protein [Pseudoalteromonas sp. TB64]